MLQIIILLISILVLVLISINLKKEPESNYYLRVILPCIFSLIGIVINNSIPFPIGFIGALYLVIRTDKNRTVKFLSSIAGLILFFLGIVPSILSMI